MKNSVTFRPLFLANVASIRQHKNSPCPFYFYSFPFEFWRRISGLLATTLAWRLRSGQLERRSSVTWGNTPRPASFLTEPMLFFSYCTQHRFICRPSDSTVPTDAGIEPARIDFIRQLNLIHNVQPMRFFLLIIPPQKE